MSNEIYVRKRPLSISSSSHHFEKKKPMAEVNSNHQLTPNVLIALVELQAKEMERLRQDLDKANVRLVDFYFPNYALSTIHGLGSTKRSLSLVSWPNFSKRIRKCNRRGFPTRLLNSSQGTKRNAKD